MLRLIFLLSVFAATPVLADPAADFARLIEDFEAHELAHDPIRAGRRGDLEAASRWPDNRPETLADKLSNERAFRDRLAAIDEASLNENDQVSHLVMAHLLDSRLATAEFEPQRMSFTNDSGFFSVPVQVASSTRARSVEAAEAWIARLDGIADYFATQAAWLERGVASGFVQPELVVRRVIEQLESVLAIDPDEHPLLSPMQQLPDHIEQAERERLRRAARSSLVESALPAYRELLTFFQDRYLAEPRATIGISDVPGGREYYRWLVRHHTTLDTTPEAVHQQGLAEVERIRGEMEAVIEQTDFEGSFAEFLHFMRTDPQFYAESERELLMQAAWIAKRADDAMPRFFRHLPRLPYGVRAVPGSIAPNYTTGRYWSGDLDTGIAGGYMVNTYRLDQRPLYELPALTLHEAVPGHHHQVAIAQELENVPEFRRNTYITAFGEGWALYTEWLGIEMDIYETPYEHFGRLTYEMWRACRLVVDTGIHYFGWTQASAEACLLENSALAPHNVRTEVERYISWPGQALAYKTGELLIRELRAEAESALGAEFDVRDFHDHLLAVGAIPLEALALRMRNWITENQGD